MHFNSKYIEDIVGFSATLGLSRKAFDDLLKSVNLSKGSVDYDVVVKFLKVAIEGTGNNCFGLHLGEYYVLKATAQVDGIMENSLTVRDAFLNAVTYSKLISDAMDCELVEMDKNYFGVTFKNNPDWHVKSEEAKRHNLDTALVSAIKSLVFLTGNRYYPFSVKLPYPRVKQLNEYYRVFNCSLTFNSDYAEIIFDKRLLSKKIETCDSGLLQKLTLNAQKQIQQIGTGDDLVRAIKRAILKQIEGTDYPTINEVATKLNITTRTLQRRLKAKNMGFSSILSEVKLNLALRHLVDDQLKIEEIAYLIGYSESSAFVRAFKKWKGVSPKAYLMAAKHDH